jgi:hypothetical protein
MTTAHFNFFSQSQQPIITIMVDLLDTPASRAWQYAVKLNSPKKNVFARTSSYYNDIVNHAVIEKNIRSIEVSLEKLCGTRFAYSEKVPTKFEDFDQHLCNRLHRHYTQSCQQLWDITFVELELQQKIDPWIQQLNNSVHLLEQFVATTQKTAWHKVGQELFVCSNGSDISYDIMPFRPYHSFEPADLILDPHILGKTLIESFMCDDDPTNWDTSGHVRTNGGSCFILTDHRQKIYQSLEFSNWLEQHGTRPELVHADIPLGNFVSGHKEKLLDFMQSSDFLGCYCLVTMNI